MAYYPGITSFLGGAGIQIVKGSKNRDLSWTIISQMLDPNLPHSARVGGNPPPSEIAWGNPPWNAPHFNTARRQLRASLPPEYPRPPFAQVRFPQTNLSRALDRLVRFSHHFCSFASTVTYKMPVPSAPCCSKWCIKVYP